MTRPADLGLLSTKNTPAVDEDMLPGPRRRDCQINLLDLSYFTSETYIACVEFRVTSLRAQRSCLLIALDTFLRISVNKCTFVPSYRRQDGFTASANKEQQVGPICAYALAWISWIDGPK